MVIDGSDRLKEGAKITIPADKPQGGFRCFTALRAHGARRHRRASGAHRGHHRKQPQRKPHDHNAHCTRMNPSRPFILRPVGTALLMAAIMLVGLVALRFLPLSALPAVDYPTIQVQTFYPGASPDVMTSSVTAPLEKQFGQMASLNQMSSQSSAGASVITLQFSLDLPLDIAEQEVQAAINAAGNLLPSDLPAPPIYAKVNPADAPIITLAISSKTLPLTQVQDLADTRLAQKISQVGGRGAGVGQRRQPPGCADSGEHARAGVVWPEYRRLAHHHFEPERQHAEGQFRRPVARLHDQRERPAHRRQRVQERGHRVQERPAGDADGRRDHRAGRGKHQARRVGGQHAGHHPERAAPAGRERDRGGRRHQDDPAAVAGGAAGRARRARSSPTAPPPSAPPCATCSSNWRSRWCWSCW